MVQNFFYISSDFKYLMKALLMFLFLSLTAHATEQNKFYAGGLLGASGYDLDCEAYDCDDGDTGWKLVGGYQINDIFSVEVGYVDFGTLTAEYLYGSGNDVDIDIESTFISGVASWSLNDSFSLHGKLGLHFWDLDSSNGTDDEGSNVMLGAGAQYALTEHLALRGEYEYYGGGSGQYMDLLSAGIIIMF